MKAEIEIRDDGKPETGGLGLFEHINHPRQDVPGGSLGVVIEKLLKGWVRDGSAHTALDDASPPCPLGFVAIGGIGEVGVAGLLEGCRKAGGQGAVREVAAVPGEDAGVDVGDRIGGVDESASGIEEKNGRHDEEVGSEVD